MQQSRYEPMNFLIKQGFSNRRRAFRVQRRESQIAPTKPIPLRMSTQWATTSQKAHSHCKVRKHRSDQQHAVLDHQIGRRQISGVSLLE
jgi:hypothetical protein